jgi:glycosyltransferase involved in cell wall biosynthesis
MGDNILTVIIPFLNEKEEVYNTVKSLRDHSLGTPIEILLIDDASDDEYGYEQVANKFDAKYIRNVKRLGVAASRDLGVSLSTTPYIMFLDSHMRFYDNLWFVRIIDELKKDGRTLLCCQSKGLTMRGNEIVEIAGRPLSYGTYVNLYQDFRMLECNWIFKTPIGQSQTINIPCVFGAAYACCREYWLYLKGVQGLKTYGNDETYISMKVWMEGGTCKLLNDVFIGHIYRDIPPYKVEISDRIYNRYLIAELLLEDSYRARVFSYLRQQPEAFKALFFFYKNRKEIYFLKEYYKRIFNHDFSYFKRINELSLKESKIKNKKDLLSDIVHHVLLNCNLLQDDGIINGRMGVVIFLFHYAQYSNCEVYSQLADSILDDVLSKITIKTPLTFENGLLGIAWGIEYLEQNKFINCDTNKILEEIDKKILDFDYATLKSEISCMQLIDITLYVLSRLYTINKENKYNPFGDDVLLKIYNCVIYILAKDKFFFRYDILIQYCIFYEMRSKIHKPSIYDVICLTYPEQYDYKKFAIGLNGNSGIGLKLIIDA